MHPSKFLLRGSKTRDSQIGIDLDLLAGPCHPVRTADETSVPSVSDSMDFSSVLVPTLLPRINLTVRQSSCLNHFIHDVNLNFTILDESGHESRQIRPSNFWSSQILGMALFREPLLHAVLAISALQEANMKNQPEHEALLDYHQAIRKLAKAFREPEARDQDDLFAACLILAYFETMSGETMKWGRHLQGACDIARYRINRAYSSNDLSLSPDSSQPPIGLDLLWFHIHQDTIQSIISGNGLYLDLELIFQCLLRGEPGSITFASDQLRVFLAQVGDFVFRDKRKESGHAGLQTLEEATQEWEHLLTSICDWREALASAFGSAKTRRHTTPFGDPICYSHPTISSTQIMPLAAVLHLHRAHPSLSHIPAEAIRSSIAITYPIGRDILRMLTGIMLDFREDTAATDHGFHIKAMINAVLPALLAGVALRIPEQREYLEAVLVDIYSYTGWRTVIRVLQGLDVAWQRMARMVSGMRSLDEDPYIERERSASEVNETRYIYMDKPETLNSAAGVLGKAVFGRNYTYALRPV